MLANDLRKLFHQVVWALYKTPNTEEMPLKEVRYLLLT